MEVNEELFSILQYWMQYTVDNINTGFYGRVDNENVGDKNAPKGSVMHARILWAFSSAYNFCSDQKYLSVATRAFHYLQDHFIDKKYGGAFWTVDAKGIMLDDKKQIYSIAFCIYGMSEYYLASGNKEALALTIELYNSIEQHSYDIINKGYFEAFKRDWSTADDLRLSAKDANEKKTMNTHLHIVEAYANLYRIYKNEGLRGRIAELLELFDIYFLDHKTFHLKLFFDERWNEKPDITSYGHDIEAAWLLQRCAEIIQNKNWINTYKGYAVKIVDASIEGLDKDGGLWYECTRSLKGSNSQSIKIVREKHWWPQAEAMVGFFNAWQITNDEKYLKHSTNSWEFIKQYIIDKKKGEWFWGVNENYSIMRFQDKAGIWKCPYHNSRACLEIINRIND